MFGCLGSYEHGKWFKIGKLVVVQGLVKSNDFESKQLIATLPEGCRPGHRLLFSLDHHGATYRVDVLHNGQIVWVIGTKVYNWISLSGIVFMME